MSKELTYHEQMEIDTIKKIRELERSLPGYITVFVRGIENTTAPRTRIGYCLDIKTFFEYLCLTNPLLKNCTPADISLGFLNELRAVDFEEYMDYLKLYEKEGKQIINKEHALKRKMSALRTLFDYLYKNDMITSNEIMKVSMPKLHQKAIVRMEPNEVALFLDEVESGTHLTDKQREYHQKTKTRDLALLTLMLGTGIRVSECVGLNIEDVDFDNCCIKVTRKGGYEALVYFGDEVEEVLLEYMEERKGIEALSGHEHALFLSSQKRRFSVRSVENLVKKYAQITTPLKKITPHKLRSTYGTNLYRESEDIYLVADVLGHKDVNTTKKHYADIDESQRRNARNKVKLRRD